MNNFQTILIAIFLAFFVFAVIIFSGIIKIGGSTNTSTTPVGNVVIWGTLPYTPEFGKVLEDIASNNKDLNVTYEKKSEDTYATTLIEAFANGKGPDIFIMTPDLIAKFKNFAQVIPFASYPQKTFQDSFIDGASIYLDTNGIIAFPLVVDPIVLYYNKDLLSNEGIVKIPEYWDELFNLSSKLTKRKNDGTIDQSMIALGRYDNVSHAKDILATLLLQSGNTIVQMGDKGYVPVIAENPNSMPVSPAEQIMNFFIEFSNPSDSAYSWNKALPKSIDQFTGGKLAMYIGKSSELFKIESVNPNLSFDVAPILQTRGTNTKRTYGTIYALAINKKTTNPTAAFGVAGMLTAGDIAKSVSTSLSLPPASRALLNDKPTDPYLYTFFNSAIISKTWADPDPVATDGVFAELLQNILSNKLSVGDALNKAQAELGAIIKK